jgi:uncharacterized protein YdcH (DUF465 family)
MGYLQVQEASTFVLGVPAATQTQFVIEGAFTKVLPSAEARFRRLLDLMDRVEDQIEDNTENVAVDRVDEIELRKDELTQLIKRYKYWQGSLSNLLGVPPNPFDARVGLGAGYNGGGSGVNVPVL